MREMRENDKADHAQNHRPLHRSRSASIAILDEAVAVVKEAEERRTAAGSSPHSAPLSFGAGGRWSGNASLISDSHVAGLRSSHQYTEVDDTPAYTIDVDDRNHSNSANPGINCEASRVEAVSKGTGLRPVSPDPSLWLFGLDNKFRMAAVRLVQHKWVQMATLIFLIFEGNVRRRVSCCIATMHRSCNLCRESSRTKWPEVHVTSLVRQYSFCLEFVTFAARVVLSLCRTCRCCWLSFGVPVCLVFDWAPGVDFTSLKTCNGLRRAPIFARRCLNVGLHFVG
jgi:hypothetical protein